MAKREKNFIHVFFSPLSAIFFLFVRPKVFLLAAAPVVINIFILAMIYTFLDQLLTEPLLEWIEIGSPTWDSILSWTVAILMGVMIFFISAVAGYFLMIPIGAPFCDLIAEEVEKEMLASQPHLLAPPQTIVDGIIHAILDAGRRVLYILPILIITFTISFIPGIGPLIAVAVGFVSSSLFLAIDGYSYVMDRRSMKFQHKWLYLKNNNDIWVPLGMCVGLLAFIPCNLVWLPVLSTIAATRLYCERLMVAAESTKKISST